MTKSEELLSQLEAWLADDADAYQIDARFDLPDMGWVRVYSIARRGDLLVVTWKPTNYLSGLVEPVRDLLCDLEALKAIKRKLTQKEGDELPF